MASKKELKALITLAGKVDPSLQTALMKASADTSKVSNKLAKLQSLAAKGLKYMAKATTAGVAAGATALGALTVKATESADELMKLKDKTGMSAEELQRLQYVSNQLGANFEAMPQAINILTKNMASAKSGSKDTAAAFQALGISITDGTGKLRSQSQVFQEALVQLSKIQNQSERNALAFQLFGKGAAETFPLLNAGAGEIQKLASEADKLGIVMSDSTVNALDNLGDTMDKIKLAAKGFGNQLIAKLLPNIQPVIDNIIDKIPVITDVLSNTGGTFFEGIANILPQVLSIAGNLMPLISQISNSISQFAPIIVNTIQQVLPIAMQIAQAVIPLLNQGLEMLISIIQPIIPGLMQLIQQILPIAVQLINMLFIVIQPLIPILIQVVQTILPPIMMILQSLMPLIQALIPLISGVANVISNILGEAIKFITPLLKGFADFISSIVGGVGKVIGGIGKLLGLSGKSVDLQANISTGSIPKFASGGFSDTPAIFGEAGLEAAIPIKYRNPRSISLLNQTAKMIGANTKGSVPNLALSFNFYGPVSNKNDIIEGVNLAKDYIVQVVREIFEEEARVALG